MFYKQKCEKAKKDETATPADLLFLRAKIWHIAMFNKNLVH